MIDAGGQSEDAPRESTIGGGGPREGEITFRVRYAETDQMGVVHHANYLVYFEMGRTELLRLSGVDYRAIEQQGFLLVIVKALCRFKAPARYDDVLTLKTTLQRVTSVRIDHAYQLTRAGLLLAEGETTLACVDRDGRPRALPPTLANRRGVHDEETAG